jgi:hypothetical protein
MKLIEYGKPVFKFSEPGDCIEGLWKGIEEGTDYDYGIIKTEDATVKFAMSTTLKDLVNLPKNIYVSITYLGTVTTRSKRDVKTFRVMIDADEFAKYAED